MFNTSVKLSFLRKFVSSISVPHDFIKFRTLDHVKLFNASELQNYCFYLFVPIYFLVTPLPSVIDILLLSYIVRMSYSDVLNVEMLEALSYLLKSFLI